MKSQSELFSKFEDSVKSEVDVFKAYNKELNITIFFQEQLCNISVFNRELLPNILVRKEENLEDILTGLARVIDFNQKNEMDLLLQILFSGLMLYYDHNRNIFLLIDISQALRRSTSDSLIEPKNILGSRDGFTENFKDNVALIRTRIKSSNLVIDELSVGRRSKTWVGVLSVEDIHNNNIKEQLVSLIRDIDIDACLSIDDIVKQSQFKGCFYQYIGSPDLACKHLLEGQFVVVIDRIPMVLILPTSFGTMSKLRIDELGSPIYKLFQRLLILVSLVFAILLPALLLSFITYQSDCLSLTVLSTMLVTQKGSIFPPILEVMLILILFEFYYLIAFRSSEATISSTIVLIGGLIIGQNAIDSGIVGVIIMTVVALSFLSTFVVTNNISFITYISLMRFIFLISALFFGLYGVILCLIISVIYASSKQFLNVSFFSPFIPLNSNDLKIFFFSRSYKRNKKRLDIMHNTDRTSKK